MTKKTYRVCGIKTILGVAPGGVLETELSEAHEARLLSIGAIKPMKKKATTKSPTPAADAAEPEE